MKQMLCCEKKEPKNVERKVTWSLTWTYFSDLYALSKQ